MTNVNRSLVTWQNQAVKQAKDVVIYTGLAPDNINVNSISFYYMCACLSSIDWFMWASTLANRSNALHRSNI
jgi:hypothetical protein